LSPSWTSRASFEDSPENAAATVVISTLLYEPVLLALRRLAQEAASADRFGLDAGPPGR